MDFDCGLPNLTRIPLIPRKEGRRKGALRHRSGRSSSDRNTRGDSKKSAYGRAMMGAPAGTGGEFGDDIYADDSPSREGRPRLSSSGQNDGSDASCFSDGDADSTKCLDEERVVRQGRQIQQRRRRQRHASVMEQLDKWGDGSLTSKHERRAEAVIKRQTANEREGEQESSGEKRKSYERQGGRSTKRQLTRKGSIDNSVMDQSGKDDEDITATLEGCQENVDEGDRWISRNDPPNPTNNGRRKKSDKSNATLRKLRAQDTRLTLAGGAQSANMRKSAEWIPRRGSTHIPRENAGWISRNDPPNPTKNGRWKKRSEKSCATFRKLQSQGNTIDPEWRIDRGGSSQPKKRQTKLLPDTSTSSRRRTRSAVRARSSGSEVLTIDSSSSEDEVDETSVTAHGSVTANGSVTAHASVTAQFITLQQRGKISEHESQSPNDSKPPPSSKASQNHSGSGEIEAAKRSLATAKKWAASTVDTLKTAEERLKEAQKHVSDAKDKAESAREQVEDAEAYLKSVEQKWEVIDVDEDSD